MTAVRGPVAIIRPGIVIGDPGVVVAGPGSRTGLSAVAIDPPDYWRPNAHDRETDTVWVQLTPSFRRGLPYDLSSYPADWVWPL